MGAGLSLAQHIWSKETSLDFSQLSVSQLSSSFGMDSRESFLSIWVLCPQNKAICILGGLHLTEGILPLYPGFLFLPFSLSKDICISV